MRVIDKLRCPPDYDCRCCVHNPPVGDYDVLINVGYCKKDHYKTFHKDKKDRNLVRIQRLRSPFEDFLWCKDYEPK